MSARTARLHRAHSPQWSWCRPNSRRCKAYGPCAAFEQALETHAAAQRHYEDCEARYVDLEPPCPAPLTREGPLGDRLRHWECWTAKELRALLADPDERDAFDAARAMLPMARAYGARLRRLNRAIGLDAAEAAFHAADDALDDLGARIADAPVRSLGGLAVKARVVKRHAAPDWWHEESTPERIAAQVLDAVLEMAEPRRGASAQSEACAAA